MEYTKQTWTAPTGKGLSRYAKSAESASHVTLTLDPENLTNSPTPFTMARMAHMEEGIAKAYDTAPPTPWAQYSGKDIPQLPDNLAGTIYKRDNDWTTTDGWVTSLSSSTISVENSVLVVTPTGSVAYTATAKTGNYEEKKVVAIIRKTIGNYKIQARNTSTLGYYDMGFVSQELGDGKLILVGYISTGHDNVRIYGDQNTAPFYIEKVYIGTGAYDRLVFDNSYHYRHLLNNAVVPTPQGLYFNGETSYLQSKDKVTLPDVFTFRAVVNCAVNSQHKTLFRTQNSTTAAGFYWAFRYLNTANLYVGFYDTTISATNYAIFSSFFTDNVDIKIEIQINATAQTITVYKNDVLFTTKTGLTFKKNTETDKYFYIGANIESGASSILSTSLLLGYMRNICLYDTALTDTQRNWLAQGNTPPILYDVTNYELGKADTASKANVRVSLRHGNTWFDKTWTGLANFYGYHIWTDGENIYYSNSTTHRVLNKAASTWTAKTWLGLTSFDGSNIWTDGDNIYYSYSTTQYVLNKATSTWTAKTWLGLTSFDGSNIWTDGDNIYYSYSTTQYVLNKATSTWGVKTWTGLTNFNGNNIWTDGDNIYCSDSTTQYVLNKTTSTWTAKTWTGLTNFNGNNIWTDGDNIYCSDSTTQYVLNKTTSTWTAKTWTGFSGNGNRIWTDGENICYDEGLVIPATRHNYVDDAKYNSLFGTVTACNCSTLSDRFVFRNE